MGGFSVLNNQSYFVSRAFDAAFGGKLFKFTYFVDSITVLISLSFELFGFIPVS